MDSQSLINAIMQSLGYGPKQSQNNGYSSVIQNSGISDVSKPASNPSGPLQGVNSSQAQSPVVNQASSVTPIQPVSSTAGYAPTGTQTWQNSASNGAIQGGTVQTSDATLAKPSGGGGQSAQAAMMMGQQLGNTIKQATQKGELQIPVPRAVPTATFGIPQITYGKY
jgi:hypothetical protein